MHLSSRTLLVNSILGTSSAAICVRQMTETRLPDCRESWSPGVAPLVVIRDLTCILVTENSILIWSMVRMTLQIVKYFPVQIPISAPVAGVGLVVNSQSVGTASDSPISKHTKGPWAGFSSSVVFEIEKDTPGHLETIVIDEIVTSNTLVSASGTKL